MPGLMEIRHAEACKWFAAQGVLGFDTKQPLYRLRPDGTDKTLLTQKETSELVFGFYEFWESPAAEAIREEARLAEEAIRQREYEDRCARLEALEQRRIAMAHDRATRAGITIWPMEKQRRSNVDWEAILPSHVATLQIAFERRATVRAMHATGMTFADIGIRFGLTGQSISRLAHTTPDKIAPATAEFNRLPLGVESMQRSTAKKLHRTLASLCA